MPDKDVVVAAPALADVAKPWFIQVHEFFSTNFIFGDLIVVLKMISIVVILSIFYYHGMNSISEEFRIKFPRLFSKVDIKHYNRAKWFFALVPFADIYFYILMIKNRYNTVAFLKAFGLKKTDY